MYSTNARPLRTLLPITLTGLPIALMGLPIVLVTLAAAPLGAQAPTEEPLSISQPLADALAGGILRKADELRLLQGQVRRVVAASRPATVAIEMDDSVGSGVIVSPDGLVLTAGHVCGEPNRPVLVRFPDGTRVAATSLGMNHQLDSGLVRIDDAPPPALDGVDTPGAWPHRPLARAEVQPGDWVVGLGHPNGFVTGRAPPVRLGRVLYYKEDENMICTDATLVGGDSGGPLMNLRGEVVAIHSRIGRGITENFHVPVSLYRSNWDRLLAGRMTGVPDGEDPEDWRPHVGIAVRATDDGPVVTQVFPNQPAAKAGVAVGDLILSIDDKAVDSPDAVSQAIAGFDPFDRVSLAIRRGDESLELRVWIGRAQAGFPGTRPNPFSRSGGRR